MIGISYLIAFTLILSTVWNLKAKARKEFILSNGWADRSAWSGSLIKTKPVRVVKNRQWSDSECLNTFWSVCTMPKFSCNEFLLIAVRTCSIVSAVHLVGWLPDRWSLSMDSESSSEQENSISIWASLAESSPKRLNYSNSYANSMHIRWLAVGHCKCDGHNVHKQHTE